MKRRLVAFTALIGAISAWPVHAAEFGLYPIHAVLMPVADSSSSALASLLDQQKAADQFAAGFRIRFPNVIDNVAEADRQKSYAVALQLNRLSRYAVPKPDGTTDLYVAITATVYFDNVLTGQKLFTYTSTSYRVKPVLGAPSAVKAADVSQLVDMAYGDALASLLDKAKAAFKPYSRSYRIIGRYENLYVLSGGALDGLKTDDEVVDEHDNSLKVTYVGDKYAVAAPELGSINSSQNFTKISSSALSEVNKPSLLIIPEFASGDFNEQSVGQQFSDVIGDKGPFAVTTVTPQFSAILQFVSQNTGVSQQHLGERSLPDYFGVLTISRPLHAETPTNIPHKALSIASQQLGFKVLDRGGRVLYADEGFSAVKDEIVGGATFDPAARAEIVMRNALMDVAARANSLSFSRVQLKVLKADAKGVQIDDPQGLLRPQAAITVLTSVGTQSGPILAPTWSGHVETSDGRTAFAIIDLPLTNGRPAVKSGDVIEAVAVGAQPMAGRRFNVCPHVKALGGYDLPDFDDSAVIAAAKTGKIAIQQPEEVKAAMARIAATGEFKKALGPRFVTTEFCIEPVQKIDVDAQHCAAMACNFPIHMAVGFHVRRGDQIVFQSALQQTGATQSFFVGATDENARSLLSNDLHQMASKLAAQVAGQKSFIDGLSGLQGENK